MLDQIIDTLVFRQDVMSNTANLKYWLDSFEPTQSMQ